MTTSNTTFRHARRDPKKKVSLCDTAQLDTASPALSYQDRSHGLAPLLATTALRGGRKKFYMPPLHSSRSKKDRLSG